MSIPDESLQPDDETNVGQCTGDPYTCQCEACRALWIDLEADRQYDERKDAA